MTNRLYVGNLAFHATENLLQEQFAACGEVLSVSVVTDRETGRSRGFAFVEMANGEGARKALELDGREVEGRPLRVRVAEDRKRDDRGGSHRGGSGGGRRRGG
jgi:RNA recognition motif-containing protein